MLSYGPRDTLKDIFEPIINDIDRLVSQQINEARVKRLTEQHPKGGKITVSDTVCLPLDESGLKVCK